MALGIALDEIGLDGIEHFGIIFRFPEFRDGIIRHGMKVKMDAESGLVAFFGHRIFLIILY